MSLFSELYRKLPDIPYSIGEINETVKDITIRFKLKYDLQYTNDFFDTYYIEQFERPDQIAKKYYDDTNLAWAVLYFNNIYNVYSELPMSKTDLEHYISIKYKKEIEIQDKLNKTQKIIDLERVNVLRSELQDLYKEVSQFKQVVDNEAIILKLIADIDKLKYTIQTLKGVEYLKYLEDIKAFDKEKARLKEIELRKKEQYLLQFSLYDIDHERLETIPELESSKASLQRAIQAYSQAKLNLENKILSQLAGAFNTLPNIGESQYVALVSVVEGMKSYIYDNLTNFGIEVGSSFEMSVSNLSLQGYNDFNYSQLQGIPRYTKIKTAYDNFVEVTAAINRMKTISEEMAKSLSSTVQLNFGYKVDLVSLTKLLVGRLSSGNYNISDIVDRILVEATGITSVENQINTISELVDNIKQVVSDTEAMTVWMVNYTSTNNQVSSTTDYKNSKKELDATLYNLNRDTNGLKDVTDILNTNLDYKSQVLSNNEALVAYEGYIDTLQELSRIELLDYKKTSTYNINHENTTLSIQKMERDVDLMINGLRSYGWNERVFVDLDKIRRNILAKENEIFFLTTKKQYPSFLDTAKVYLDTMGHVVYLDPDNPQEVMRLLEGNVVKMISYRDHEYILNDKKRTIYLLKPQYIPALMDVLKQQVKLMEAATQ